MTHIPRQTIEQMRQESLNLLKLYKGQPHQLLTLLTTQLGVLKHQAQTFISLCGLAITVTGFSGAHMIRAGQLASFAMVTGIALILIAIFLCLRVLTNLRWVTQDVCEDLEETAYVVIKRRNEQQQKLLVVGTFVAFGLAFYLIAVMIAALYPPSAT